MSRHEISKTISDPQIPYLHFIRQRRLHGMQRVPPSRPELMRAAPSAHAAALVPGHGTVHTYASAPTHLPIKRWRNDGENQVSAWAGIGFRPDAGRGRGDAVRARHRRGHGWIPYSGGGCMSPRRGPCASSPLRGILEVASWGVLGHRHTSASPGRR